MTSSTISPRAGEPSERVEFQARLRGLISECSDLRAINERAVKGGFRYDKGHTRDDQCVHQIIMWLSEFEGTPDNFWRGFNRVREAMMAAAKEET